LTVPEVPKVSEPKSDVLLVTEIFRSIQGESTFAGRPCVFVRLSGCNLRCRYCDTRYAYDPGQPMSGSEVLARVDALGGELVEVTGGEPLMQDGAHGLLNALAAAGKTVLLETNGSLPLPADRAYRVIMDVKCPASGETDKVHWENVARLQPGDELKFVAAERADFDWAVATIHRLGLGSRGLPLLFAPVHGKLAPERLAEWILGSGLELRLQLQLHKVVWPGKDRGV